MYSKVQHSYRLKIIFIQEYFKVAIEDKYSTPKELPFSVPQVSCSGVNLCTCYCSLINDQINHSFTLNAFADDHSICKNFKAGNMAQEQQTKTDLEEAFKQAKYWMDTMHFKLNPGKTEYILFGSQAQLKKISPEPLNAHDDLIEVIKVVRYLGGFLDQQLNFKQHVKEEVKKAITNLIKICAICKYLTEQTCTTLILMFCITLLDYANAILYGLLKSTLQKYQAIQIMCAKLVLNKNKYSSTSSALKKLHWFPIQ